MISKTIDIVVTSVLQTTAGKMIFGRFIESGAGTPATVTAIGDREKNEPARVRVAAPVQQQS